MQADEQDILIWDSEIRRPRIGSCRKWQTPRRAAFILDDPQTTDAHPDKDQSQRGE